MAWPLIAAAAAPIVGGMIGSMASSGDASRARAAQLEALNQLRNIKAPTEQDLAVQFGEYDYLGDFNPQMEGVISQGASEFGNIATDPRLKQAQLEALATMQRINEGGGMTDMERAALSQLSTDAQSAASQQGAALREDFARRGMAGSGMEMMQRQMANENAINQMADGQMDINAQAQARALQNLQNMSGLAGTMEDRDFGQQAQRAQANDVINAFNAQTRQGVQTRNVGNQNQYGYQNLQNRQQTKNANVDLKNDQKLQNSGARQQVFDNNLNLGSAKAGAYDKQAQNYQNSANSTKQMWGGIGQGVGTMIGGMGKK